MRPHDYRQHFIAAVVRRSGICRVTVERVLPAVFDEIRYQITEGPGQVPIESFGTFAVIDIPERQRRYTYGGRNELRTLPPTQRLKFAATRNFRNEVKEHRFDPSRKSFTHNPKDPLMRKRKNLQYNKRKEVFTSVVPNKNTTPTPPTSSATPTLPTMPTTPTTPTPTT